MDNGVSRGRVERWTWNVSNVNNVMSVNGSCFSLFLGPNDTLYCSLSDLHQVVSTSLRYMGTTPAVVAGSVASTLNFPLGIFVDSSENLYIADSGNNRIQFYSPGAPNGITVAGNGVPNNLTLHTPIGVLLDADGSLFILEEGNGRIIRSSTNHYHCIIGCTSSGNGPSQLNGPSSFQFDNLGNLFVVDRNNVRIQKFLLASNSCGRSIDDPLPVSSLITCCRSIVQSASTLSVCQLESRCNHLRQYDYHRFRHPSNIRRYAQYSLRCRSRSSAN